MSELKSKFEEIVDKLDKEGKVSTLSEEKSAEINQSLQQNLDEYRFENQKKIRESQEEIATVILTA